MSKINEKNKTRDMETWNRLIAVGGEEGGRMVEGRGRYDQRTCMNDIWT